jgi:hypothetical protein
MNAKYLTAAVLVTLTALSLAGPVSVAARGKSAKHAAKASAAKPTMGKFGTITPNDLQGTYEAYRSWNFDTKKWDGPMKAYIALTKVAPGKYKFPGFDDVLKGSSKVCNGVLTPPASAVSPGGHKEGPKPVRFEIKGNLLYEYQEKPGVLRFVFKKIADDPGAFSKM